MVKKSINIYPESVPTVFDSAMEYMLANEGGHSDNPDDPGGETYMGISSVKHPELDVTGLSHKEAHDFYFSNYWKPYRAAGLPDKVAIKYFDTLVNFGPYSAALILQYSLMDCGVGHIKADGVVGSRTVGAAYQVDEDLLLPAMCANQLRRYLGKITHNPKLKTFLNGWSRRAYRLPTD